MQDVQSYQDLMIWQKGMDLAEETYRITLRLPREEQFALIDQLRRSAISIPSNIAEVTEEVRQKNTCIFCV